MVEVPVAPSAGDIIGLSFRLYKRHLPGFLLVLLWPTVFATIFGLGLAISWSYVVGHERSTHEVVVVCMLVAFACLIASLMAKWILTLRQLALINLSFGFASDFKAAYDQVKAVGFDVLAVVVFACGLFCLAALLLTASFLFFVGKPQSYFAAFIDWLIFGFVLCFALFIPVLMLITFMTICSLICQKTTVIAALKAGAKRTYYNFYRSIGFALALFVVISVLSYPLSLPIVLMSAFDVAGHGINHEAYQMPIYMMVIGQCWESFINMFLWPVIYLAYGLFYMDLRIRKEGLDLSRRLKSMEASSASG